jgi:uncharacterized protein (TIGR00251 family)
MIELKDDGRAVTFAVRVSPRASRSQILGEHSGALKVSLAAPPVEGEANRALCELLAKRLSVPKSAVRIVGGLRGKSKIVHIQGVQASAVQALARPADHSTPRKT